jgi:hypothetical protein
VDTPSNLAAGLARPRWVLPAIWVLLTVGLLTALYSASRRIAADAAYRDVMVLVDWHDLNSLPETGDAARLSELRTREAPWKMMAQLPGAYLCYGEETVGDLVESGVLRRADIVGTAPTYEVAQPQYFMDVARGALRHGYASERDIINGRPRLLVEFPALPQIDLEMLPVCWRADVIGLIRSRNVPLILRPGGTEFMRAGGVAETLAYCAGQPVMLFQGPQVLGYPQGLRPVADQIRRVKQRFAWVEFDEQDGGGALASLLGPDGVVRLHSIPAEEMVNYDVAGAVDRLLRAARERDMRLLYLRPFVRGKVISSGKDYAQQLEALNADYFRKLRAALEADGFRIAPSVQTPAEGPGKWVRLPIMLGACSGILWLLALWFPGIPARWWPWLLGLSAAGSSAAALNSALLGIGLLKAAIAFPLLGLWLGWTLYQRWTHGLPTAHPLRLGAALCALLAASAGSLAGGLLIHGGLWDAHTMLHLGQFRGVSLALALPVLLLAAYAWQAESLQDGWDGARRALVPYWQRFLALWTSPIRYGDVAFIMVALGALAIVMLRSGNDGPLGPLDMETMFRGSLEHFFSVRPRTKELLGHPLLVLFFLSLPWRSRVSVLFALAGLLGQVSILNTCCHLHTPFALTLQRIGLGLLIGLCSAALWGAVALAIAWAWGRLRRS